MVAREKIVKGISWNIINQVVIQSVGFIISVVLARLLSPEEFGIVGLVTVFTGFAAIFLDLGFGAALVQKKSVTDTDLSTVFWFNIAAGTFLTLLLASCSGLLSRFYEKPILQTITIIISLNFFIRSLAVVQNNIFLKKIDFKSLTIRNILTTVLSGGAAITMAFLGYGVWSIVAQSLLTSTLSTIFIWFLSSWRPRFLFSWDSLREMRKFSANLVANNSLNYWTRNLDNFLIGKFIGASALGIYSKAYGLMLLPLNNVSRVISNVLFPSFSSIQDDITRIRNIYLKITRSIALITFPLMIGLLVVANDFVLTLFGNQWAPMVPVLQILCIPGMLQSIGSLNGSIYQSLGKTDLQFKVTSILKVARIILLIVGIYWGIIGVAWAYAISVYILIYPMYYFPCKLVNISFKELLANVAPVFTCAISMGAMLWLSGQMMTALPTAYRLFIQIILGITIYLGTIHIFNISAYQELRTLVSEQINKKKATTI